MHPDIFTPGTYLIIVFLCLTIDVPLTARHIFEDNLNWAGFRLAEKDNLRDVEIKEVNKMLSCKDESRGFFTYECGCSPLIVGVFISFFFIFYRQCDNNKMIEEPKKNEGANGRIMIRHVPIQIATFME